MTYIIYLYDLCIHASCQVGAKMPKEPRRHAALSDRCFKLMMEIAAKMKNGALKKSMRADEAFASTFRFLNTKTEEQQHDDLAKILRGSAAIFMLNERSRADSVNKSNEVYPVCILLDSVRYSLPAECARNKILLLTH